MSRSSDQQSSPMTRTALITGGASGIGKAIAQSLAANKVEVVISDINHTAGAQLAAELEGHFIPSDLCDPAAGRALVADASAICGGIDILINNAGMQHVCAIENFPEDQWARMIQLMLISPFSLIRAVWPHMKARGWGRVVNIGSIHSHVASVNKSAYVSAKHGLLGLTKSAALEAGEQGITVNAVCPAYVKTPLVESQIADQARTLGIDQSRVVEEVMLGSAAIKRLIDPTEVAELVAYLCSDKASAITGSAFDIDLGWVAR